jgi:hypothetical protein
MSKSSIVSRIDFSTKYDHNKFHLIEKIMFIIMNNHEIYTKCACLIKDWSGNPASLYCCLIQKPYIAVKRIYNAIYSINLKCNMGGK